MWRNFKKNAATNTKPIDRMELIGVKMQANVLLLFENYIECDGCKCTVCERNNMFDIFIETTVYSGVMSLRSRTSHSAQQKYRYFMLKMEYTSLISYSANSVHCNRRKTATSTENSNFNYFTVPCRVSKLNRINRFYSR